MSIYKSGAVGMSAALAEQLRDRASTWPLGNRSGRLSHVQAALWEAIEVNDAKRMRELMQVPDVGDNPYIRNAMLSNLHQNISAAAYAYRCGVLVSCLVIDTWSQKLQNPGVLHKTVLAKAISIHNELHPHPILRGAKS